MSSGLLTDVRREVLDNGLTVLVKEDFAAPVCCLQLFVKVGSNHETDAEWGWSHGIEHMFFKGTEKRGSGDMAREVGLIGGDLNAATGYESTAYHIVCPVAGFETALELHADALANAAFREDDLASERNVLLEELQMYKDVPDGFGHTWDVLMGTAFERHRYGKSIIGDEVSLKETSREAIVDYFRRGYVPANMVYCVTGAVPADEAVAAVRRHLGGLASAEAALSRPEPEPPQTSFRHVAMTGDVEAAYFKIGFHVPEEPHADTAALNVLTHLLGSGRSARLYQEVLESRGLVSQISVMKESGRDPGILVVDAVTEPEKLEAAIAATYEEIGRFHRHPVPDVDLEKSLNNVIADFVSALETVQGQSSVLGRFELLGGYALADEMLARIARVSAADVRRVARRYLTFDGSTVLTYLPGPAAEPTREGEAALRDRLEARLAEAVGSEPAPADPPDSPPRNVPAIKMGAPATDVPISRHELPGGARLLCRPVRRAPLMALAAYVRAGSRFETPETLGVGTLTARSLIKGTHARGQAELAQAIEHLGITLFPFTDRDTMGFYVEALTGHAEVALDLFAEILHGASFPDEAVAREREMLLADLVEEQDDTFTITMNELRKLLFGDHPYGYHPLGTPETIASLTPDHLRGWRDRFFVQGGLHLAAVGDVDPDAITAGLARRLDRLRDDAPPTPPTVGLAARTEGARTELVRDKAQAVIIAGLPAPSLHDPSRFAHAVMNAVLNGMGSRLFEELREKRHLCYFTGSSFSALDDAGAFAAYVGTSAEHVDGALDALLGELRRIGEAPPSDDEMTRAINTLVGHHTIALQRSGSQAAAFARLSALGREPEDVLRYPERIRAITGDDVLAAARATLDVDRAAIALLRPGTPGTSTGG